VRERSGRELGVGNSRCEANRVDLPVEGGRGEDFHGFVGEFSRSVSLAVLGSFLVLIYFFHLDVPDLCQPVVFAISFSLLGLKDRKICNWHSCVLEWSPHVSGESSDEAARNVKLSLKPLEIGDVVLLS